jgi:riboflavin kinase/FMN adenylyltransferase
MPTKLIRSLYNIAAAQQGTVLTMGNFDGVHLGHQQLIAQTVAQAEARGVSSTVVTFEPHAFEYFAGQNVTIPRLTRLREKFLSLAACGIDNVIILPFNQLLANQSASDFIAQMAAALHPVHMVVGDDFRFGQGRSGDFALLQQLGDELGFTAESLPTVMVEGERVSSTRIRKALAAGDLGLAKQLLGRAYSMMGRVRHGDKLGRQLGFPTANIFLHRKLTPVRGIYTVLMHGIADHPWRGAANIGTRPTVDGTRTLLEVHLLDFHRDIYGRYVQVEFCEKLRDEQRYANLEILKAEIANDVAATQDYFNQRGVK